MTELLAFLSKDYSIKSLKQLPGEVDLNFLMITDQGASFLVKLVQGSNSQEFQNDLLHFLSSNPDYTGPRLIKQYPEALGDYNVKIISWIEGKVWASNPHPKLSNFLNLGKVSGRLTKHLKSFEHPKAHFNLEWDLAQALWIEKHLSIFDTEQREYIQRSIIDFKNIQEHYKLLPKSIIHNDVNEHNIIIDPEGDPVEIIDFGDAIYSQTINDLAILIAYATMELDHPHKAAKTLIQGYHSQYSLSEAELDLLEPLIRMRYAVSLTKSKLNSIAFPEQTYLQVSAQKTWKGLQNWSKLNPQWTRVQFYSALEKTPSDLKEKLAEISKLNLDFSQFCPNPTEPIDLSVESSFLASLNNEEDLSEFQEHLQRTFPENTTAIGGYLEARTLYTSEAFQKIDLNQINYRSIHLGIDLWFKNGHVLKAPLDGKIVLLENHQIRKDYGPLIVLEHLLDSGRKFYTLYGHLSTESTAQLSLGQQIKQGQKFAEIGNSTENGNWVPHLHFQLVMDLLGNTKNFPGVAYPDDIEAWKMICPSPMILFKNPPKTKLKQSLSYHEILKDRKQNLGTNLSLSYEKPLLILKGKGSFLYDYQAQKYLDLVNNVAHVGHENPNIIKAGNQQSYLLNTNSRYLHPSRVAYAKELMATLPKRFSRVYFVNSGSEANELAIRMAKTFTGYSNILALDHGYHGNTSQCIDISSYKFQAKGGRGKVPSTLLASAQKSDDQRLKTLGQEIALNPVAGYIYESIQSCAGQIPLNPELHKNLEGLIHDQGGLSIADEVQTGFGRIGSHFWAFEAIKAQPDIVTMGKPIGNGHPLAAVACTEEVAQGFDNGMEYFNTFGGNPVSCEIGRAVLREVKGNNLQQNALNMGDLLIRELHKITLPNLYKIRGKGLFLGIEFRDSIGQADGLTAKRLAEGLKDLGVLISTDGPQLNVLKIKPPITINSEEILDLIHKIKLILPRL
ncbi:MAG: aminotransferase class III-fold pyridoxal phosphate-dependent enzyme [Flavobacteriaceae bacterium]